MKQLRVTNLFVIGRWTSWDISSSTTALLPHALGHEKILWGFIVGGCAADYCSRCGCRRQLWLLRCLCMNMLTGKRRIWWSICCTDIRSLHSVMLVDRLSCSRIIVNHTVLLLLLLLGMYSITADGLLVHRLGVRVLMTSTFQRITHWSTCNVSITESIATNSFCG